MWKSFYNNIWVAPCAEHTTPPRLMWRAKWPFSSPNMGTNFPSKKLEPCNTRTLETSRCVDNCVTIFATQPQGLGRKIFGTFEWCPIVVPKIWPWTQHFKNKFMPRIFLVYSVRTRRQLCWFHHLNTLFDWLSMNKTRRLIAPLDGFLAL